MEIMAVLGVLLLVGALSYVGYKTFIATPGKDSSVATGSSSQVAEVITSKEDLEEAAKKLDDLSFEDESSVAAATQAEL